MRPKKISCVEELVACKNGYFKTHNIETGNPPTMSGFARYCGFRNRSALMAYQDDEDPRYQEVLEECKLIIEEYAETQLHLARNSSGARYVLEHMNDGWDSSIDINAKLVHSVEDLLAQSNEEEQGSGM